jgi:pyruvate-formate lyase-activating enzyme
MLSYCQLFIVEIGARCNLASVHKECPSSYRPQNGKPITDEMAIEFFVEAYKCYNFTGICAFHYHNEPMIKANRLFHIMKEVKKVVPDSRWMLWTNGTITPDDEDMSLFNIVNCSNYDNKPDLEAYYKKYSQIVNVFVPAFDQRTADWRNNPIQLNPCTRVINEVIIDNWGEIHYCCQDWKNELNAGNVWTNGLDEILKRRTDLMEHICRPMNDSCPDRCLRCNGKSAGCPFVPEIYNKAIEYYK